MEDKLRKLLERVGGFLDRALGREGESLNLAKLMPKVQQAIDRQLSADDKGLQRVPPNKITLRLKFDLHSKLDAQSLKELENGVSEIALQHIRDHRYLLRGQLTVAIIADALLNEPFALEAEHQEAARPARFHLRLAEDESVLYSLGRLEPRKRLTIGRAADNDIVINDPSLSRFHAALSMNEDGGLVIADCGSANGTFVKGERVRTSSPVQPDDEIRLGSVRLKLEAEKTEHP